MIEHVFDGKQYRCFLGDSNNVMAEMPDACVDSVITDPPYHLTSIVKRFGKEGSAPAQHGKDGAFARASRGFMGKEWDGGDIAQQPEFWAEVLRVLKPGGHLLAFSGSRTYHRMACAIEDAGFEIRDQIMWVYGSGFPKSHDVSKGIDRAAGAEREVVGPSKRHSGQSYQWAGENRNPNHSELNAAITAPATPAAKQWEGWGTALKPAHEPICVARKPLIGTVAENVLRCGTGALNIDGCRVDGEDAYEGRSRHGGGLMQGSSFQLPDSASSMPAGRWPANVIHDGSDEVVAGFPRSSVTGKRTASSKAAEVSGTNWLSDNHESTEYTDSGSAARFFYCAKASKRDRDEGLSEQRNTHPTVKPTDLMRYLCRLVTPPGGVVLDPFMGSGSTGKAAMLERFRFIGIDMTEEYFRIAGARIEHAANQ